MIDDPTILVIEDSPEDLVTTARAFQKAGIRRPIQHCADGDEALDYLFRRGAYANLAKEPLPDMVLLDLNIPGTDGRELLMEMRRDARLRNIPVIVLSTSDDDIDVEYCYRAGANSYMLKPVDLPSFQEAIRKLTEYWFDVVLLPMKSDMRPERVA